MPYAGWPSFFNICLRVLYFCLFSLIWIYSLCQAAVLYVEYFLNKKSIWRIVTEICVGCFFRKEMKEKTFVYISVVSFKFFFRSEQKTIRSCAKYKIFETLPFMYNSHWQEVCCDYTVVFVSFLTCSNCSVVDLESDLDSGSGSRRKKWHKNVKRGNSAFDIFWSAGCTLWRAVGSSCSLEVLHWGQRIPI